MAPSGTGVSFLSNFVNAGYFHYAKIYQAKGLFEA
jgi:hypothetical protein